MRSLFRLVPILMGVLQVVCVTTRCYNNSSCNKTSQGALYACGRELLHCNPHKVTSWSLTSIYKRVEQTTNCLQFPRVKINFISYLVKCQLFCHVLWLHCLVLRTCCSCHVCVPSILKCILFKRKYNSHTIPGTVLPVEISDFCVGYWYGENCLEF